MYSRPTGRTLAIIKLLAADTERSFGLTELCRRLGMNKATCHSILSTMSQEGFLVQDPRSRGYRLGPMIISAGMAASENLPRVDAIRPLLNELQIKLHAGVALVCLSRSHVVILEIFGTASKSAQVFRRGMRIPRTAQTAACFTSFSPPKDLEPWLKRLHEVRGSFDSALDNRLRISSIATRSRGFDVTLETKAEQNLIRQLKRVSNPPNLDKEEELLEVFQRELMEEQYHLDHIASEKRYKVSTLSVPIPSEANVPPLCVVAGSFTRSLTGSKVLSTADLLLDCAARINHINNFLAESQELTPDFRASGAPMLRLVE